MSDWNTNDLARSYLMKRYKDAYKVSRQLQMVAKFYIKWLQMLQSNKQINKQTLVTVYILILIEWTRLALCASAMVIYYPSFIIQAVGQYFPNEVCWELTQLLRVLLESSALGPVRTGCETEQTEWNNKGIQRWTLFFIKEKHIHLTAKNAIWCISKLKILKSYSIM